jgi:hypothetical protein
VVWTMPTPHAPPTPSKTREAGQDQEKMNNSQTPATGFLDFTIIRSKTHNVSQLEKNW